MSSRTTNIGLEKVTSDQTIGDLQESMNGSGGNMDIIDTKMGPVGNTSLQAQVDALNSNLVPAYGTLTLENGVTGNVVIIRMGKMRVLTGYANPGRAGTAIVLATLDAGDRPPVNITGAISSYGMTINGELRVEGTNSGKFIMALDGTPTNTIKFNIAYAVA